MPCVRRRCKRGGLFTEGHDTFGRFTVAGWSPVTVRWLSAQIAPASDASGRPFYARALRLKHINLSSTVCFIFLEGATAFAIVLALAELIPLWGVVLLPICIAAMVKVNDVVAGAAVRAATTRAGGGFARRPMRPFRTIGRATVPGGAGADKVGRVYRSTPVDAGAGAPAAITDAHDEPADPAADDRTAGIAAGDDGIADTHAGSDRTVDTRAGDLPAARHTNPAAVNSPPVDLEPGRAARTPTARAGDLLDAPAQRARHAATRRYE
jgi:hypothetical protein